MRTSNVLAAMAVIFVFAVSTSANSIPTHGRSSYGETGSTILAPTPLLTTSDGVTFDTFMFCSDAITNPTEGTCQLAFAFQVQNALPAGTTALTITLPVPVGALLTSTSPISAGLLTNEGGDGFSGLNLPFTSGLSATDVAGLPDGAITFGLDASGNPTFTFSSSAILSNAQGLTLFMDVQDANNANFGLFCFQTGTACKAADLPQVPTPNALVAAAEMPEPASLPLLASGLLGLGGIYWRRRKAS